MKSKVYVLICLFLFFGCSHFFYVRSMEEKYYIKERNISSYNIFYQFYLEDGNVYRIKLLKNTESNSNEPYSRYPDNYPYWDYKGNPNELIQKIVIVDIDSRKILRRIEGKEIENTYKLYKYDSVYGEKVKYYIFEITDEWLENI